MNRKPKKTDRLQRDGKITADKNLFDLPTLKATVSLLHEQGTPSRPPPLLFGFSLHKDNPSPDGLRAQFLIACLCGAGFCWRG